MRTLLLSLATLCVFSSFGQTRQKSVTFDFSNPESLSPSVKRSGEDGGSVYILDSVFYSPDKKISLSFSLSKGAAVPRIVTDNASNHSLPYLSMSRNVYLNVNTDDVSITGFRIPASDVTAGLRIDATVPEIEDGDPEFQLDTDYTYWHWPSQHNGENYALSKDYTFLSFLNSSPTQTLIHKIIVDYLLPRDVLLPVSISIEDDSEINEFTEFVLEFDDVMTLAEGASFELKDGNNNSYQLSCNIENNIVTLSSSSLIDIVGDYTLTIAGGSLANQDDYRNSALSYTFKIVPPVNTFNIVSSNPAEGPVDVLSSGIELEFPGVVVIVDNSTINITNELSGEIVRTATATNNPQNDHAVILTYDNNLGDIIGGGNHYVDIPERMFYTVLYKADAEDNGISEGARFNKATRLIYNVGNLSYPSEEIRKEAVDILALTDVGYPDENSEARLKLQKLVDDRIGTDEEFQSAINNFYAEKENIVLPFAGNYYKIAAVSSEGKEVYLQYSSDRVSFTGDQSMAAAFRANRNDDGSVTLMTLDGKYLHQLINSDEYEGTSKSNLTSEYSSELNNIILKRLSIENVDDIDTFGLLSMKGNLGLNEDENGQLPSAYTLVNVSTKEILTNPGFDELEFFKKDLTNAIRISTIPKDKLPVLDAEYSIDPKPDSKVERLINIVVSFPEISSVTIEDNTKIHLDKYNKKEGKLELQISPKDVQVSENTPNQVLLYFDEVAAGDYTLVIEKGGISYMFEETHAFVQTINAEYTVITGVDYQYDFLMLPTVSVIFKEAWEPTAAIFDIDVNNVTLYSYSNVIKVDSRKRIYIMDPSTYSVKAEGIFVETTDPDLPNAKSLIKAKFDTPIQSGSISPGKYIFVAYGGTFGDENFGKYLNGDINVSKSDCHVNGPLSYMCTVDNDVASGLVTGIADVKVVETDGEVYDLQGRRMEAGSLRPGIYVKDGRKFVVK